MAAKKSIGKITIECDCGVSLECPATMKGEVACACGKTYGVNKERVIVQPAAPVIQPQPWRYTPPWDYTRITCGPYTASEVVSKIALTTGPRAVH